MSQVVFAQGRFGCPLLASSKSLDPNPDGYEAFPEITNRKLQASEDLFQHQVDQGHSSPRQNEESDPNEEQENHRVNVEEETAEIQHNLEEIKEEGGQDHLGVLRLFLCCSMSLTCSLNLGS
jgi:hypothetical protein